MIDRTALREALINAMVHNDYTREVTPVVEIYSDRLAITSYGGLVDGLSMEEFFEGRSMPRNRELMRIFRDVGLVEHLGSGIHRILSKYDRSIFRISENFLEICFPFEPDYLEALKQGDAIEDEGGTIGEGSGPIGRKSGSIGSTIGGTIDKERGTIGGTIGEGGGSISLTDRQQEVIDLLKKDNRLSVRAIAKELNINVSAVQGHLEVLKEKGAIERVGGTRGYWKINNPSGV